MIFIDLENNPPDQAWLDKADEVTDKLLNEPDLNKRNKLIDDNQKLWGELKNHLARISHNKCWYSESKNDGAYCHVDHFRPKKKAIDEDGVDRGGYWWLAFDWKNYRYSGPVPNVIKKAYFHVNSYKVKDHSEPIEQEDVRLLDPVVISDPGKLAFDIEGHVRPKISTETAREYIQAEYTIRILGLNRPEFVNSRKDRFERTARLVRSVNKELQIELKSNIYSPIRWLKIKDMQKELVKMANSKSEYSAAVKYCLISAGYDWTSNIAVNAR